MKYLIFSLEKNIPTNKGCGLFLQSIGCSAVVTAIDGRLESWIDFSFEGFKFSANKDINIWYFFEEEPCPENVKILLVSKLKSAEHGMTSIYYSIKAYFFWETKPHSN